MRFARRSWLAAAAGATAGATGARAQTEAWPTRPLRLIVAFAPGGFTDIAARLLAQAMSLELGQPVVVENRPGAAGIIGTEAAAQATADGYSLLLGTISTHAINVGLYPNLAYDPVRGFAPVSGVASGEVVLVVHPSVPAQDVAALVALARARPGALAYASGGNGTTSHLAAELFRSLARVDLLHVPFRSPAPAAVALVAGQVQLMFDTVPSALPHIRSGRLRALGIGSAAPIPEMPDVAPVALVVPGFDASTWAALYAPAGTPARVVLRLDEAVRRSLASPALMTRLAEMGMRPMRADPEALAAFQRRETEKWVGVVRSAGITAD